MYDTMQKNKGLNMVKPKHNEEPQLIYSFQSVKDVDSSDVNLIRIESHIEKKQRHLDIFGLKIPINIDTEHLDYMRNKRDDYRNSYHNPELGSNTTFSDLFVSPVTELPRNRLYNQLEFDGVNNGSASRQAPQDELGSLLILLDTVKNAPENTVFVNVSYNNDKNAKHPWEREEISRQQFVRQLEQYITQSIGTEISLLSPESEQKSDMNKLKELFKIANSDGILNKGELLMLKEASIALAKNDGDISTWKDVEQKSLATIEKRLQEANSPESLKK